MANSNTLIDTFDGFDQRCRNCPLGEFEHNANVDHKFDRVLHNISVTWVSRWEVNCGCGFRYLRGVDSKLTAELIAWLHLRRWDNNRAKEFAQNRGLTDYVYAG